MLVKNKKCKYLEITGAQPGVFQDTWYFLEWRHFDKHFIINTPKRSSTKKISNVFLNALKSAFQIRYLTYRCTQSAYLFPKPGHFFEFSEGSRRGLASTLNKRSSKTAVMQNAALHCHYFALVIWISGEFLLRSLFSIKLLLPTSFALQLATLL